MKILFTICGRAGSKGMKNKNLKEFLGYPLPFYTLSVIDLFFKSNEHYDCDIVVNTDSSELIDLFDSRVMIPFLSVKRCPELGTDDTPKIEVIRNSYTIAKARMGNEYDMVVDLDITAPLRTLADLEALIDKKIRSNVDVVFSVTTSRRNPFFNMVIKTEKGFERVIKSDYNARQEAPEVFDMNASMYAYSPKFLATEMGIFEGKCDVITMMDTAVLDIDDERDFEFMEIIGDFLFGNYQSMNIIREHIVEVIREK